MFHNTTVHTIKHNILEIKHHESFHFECFCLIFAVVIIAYFQSMVIISLYVLILFLFYNFPHYILFFIIFYLSLIPRFPHCTASELMRVDYTYQKPRWKLTHFETENKQK